MNASNASPAQGPDAGILSPRVKVNESLSLGPGKIRLLRCVGEHRSISAAARAMGMPYKRAWMLLNTINEGLGHPVVETVAGGRGGGGTRLTPLGEALLERYDALEARIREAAQAELADLLALHEPGRRA
ncbi:winged helix-turn-helix domain-containing protein [Alkalilimnicola ehrlichii MLHE-1]|uniref:Putative transcriptional regulator, ModE family n=1 Tax=Alkalilimnicola ehrlichii (strain ATCC BAA-1101 / DSM 17681 / MLHE-1) TaxID=187272 RepID=Q0A7B8_ALKEH|nr:LysR family transcriptional regulator [Alkalilimnicola ehrlichii]ABI57269.1 putative transcriptional regulator, ModE family [Alkalilimnicola ehrlichii MLHE-1]